MHLLSAPVTSHASTQATCLLLACQLLRHQWHHEPSPDCRSVRQQRLWGGIFSSEDSITSFVAQPCVCQHMVQCFCESRPCRRALHTTSTKLNWMHLPYSCGSLVLKAGCFSHELYVCSKFSSQFSIVHSASLSLYKGNWSRVGLKGENHKYFQYFLTSVRKNVLC